MEQKQLEKFEALRKRVYFSAIISQNLAVFCGIMAFVFHSQARYNDAALIGGSGILLGFISALHFVFSIRRAKQEIDYIVKSQTQKPEENGELEDADFRQF